MISQTDIDAMQPVVLTLSEKECDPVDWLHRMINLADSGTQIVYWSGETDIEPNGRRKTVFNFMMDASEIKRVHLIQRRNGKLYDYIGVVR